MKSGRLQDRQCDWQVERGAFFLNIGWCEIDGDRVHREMRSRN